MAAAKMLFNAVLSRAFVGVYGLSGVKIDIEGDSVEGA